MGTHKKFVVVKEALAEFLRRLQAMRIGMARIEAKIDLADRIFASGNVLNHHISLSIIEISMQR